MAVTIINITSNITELSSAVDTNIFITNARKAFLEDIAPYEMDDSEKAKLIASYEAQLSVGVIGHIMSIAKELPTIIAQEELIQKQIENEDKKKNVIIQQELTEKYRHRDLRASIMVKNKSAVAAKHQARFEEARKHIAIKANEQNMHLKKTEFKVQQLDAIATDEEYIIGEEHMTDVKTSIDNIPIEGVDYETEINGDDDVISTAEIT